MHFKDEAENVTHATPPTTELTRIKVRFRDDDGGLEIDHNGELGFGLLLGEAEHVDEGQEVRVRVPFARDGEHEDLVEIFGVARTPELVALKAGNMFEIEVTRMTRATVSKQLSDDSLNEERPAGLPEGFSELPTLHLPQIPIEASEVLSVAVPRDVTLGKSVVERLNVGELFPGAESDHVRPPGFTHEGDPVEVEPEGELTRLENEIHAIDLDVDVTDPDLKLLKTPKASEPASPPANIEALEEEPLKTSDMRIKGLSGLEDEDLAPAAPPPLVHLEEEPTLDEPTGVVGNLKDLSLCELVQSMEISRKTAQIVVSPKTRETGSVFLKDGKVVWAEVGELEGEDAFYELGRAFKGMFRMRFHVEAPGKNVYQPTPYLVLEALRRVDEGRVSGEVSIVMQIDQKPRERLPTARDTVVAAQRAAKRATRRQKKTAKKSRPKSIPPMPVEHPEVSAVEAEPAVESTEKKPAPTSSNLFSGFFEEAKESSDALDPSRFLKS